MKKYIVDEELLVSMAKCIKNLKLQVLQFELLKREMEEKEYGRKN